jgi:hypothetical protein
MPEQPMVTSETHVTGTGPLTVSVLTAALGAMPTDGVVTVSVSDSQRDGSSWRVSTRSTGRF